MFLYLLTMIENLIIIFYFSIIYFFSFRLAGATSGYCNMRVEMRVEKSGVSAGDLSAGQRSFHFHDNGDLRYGLTSDAGT